MNIRSYLAEEDDNKVTLYLKKEGTVEVIECIKFYKSYGDLRNAKLQIPSIANAAHQLVEGYIISDRFNELYYNAAIEAFKPFISRRVQWTYIDEFINHKEEKDKWAW